MENMSVVLDFQLLLVENYDESRVCSTYGIFD
jgi:hypothetical protein